MAHTEQKLTTATYRGETRRREFERYETVHQEQHTFLDGLFQHGYAGIDEQSKTRYLMNGIKTIALDTVKTQLPIYTNCTHISNLKVSMHQEIPGSHALMALLTMTTSLSLIEPSRV